MTDEYDGIYFLLISQRTHRRSSRFHRTLKAGTGWDVCGLYQLAEVRSCQCKNSDPDSSYLLYKVRLSLRS